MHAPIEQLAEGAAPPTTPAGRLISLSYLLLRGATAAGAVAMGFVQTFVFARALDPHQFSVFILTAAVGYSLWIADLGLAKIAFVNLRAPHLDGRRDERAASEAGAVVLFYIVLSTAAALACFGIMLLRSGATALEAFDLALFLSFIALNLAWSSLRTISLAVDLFVFFEGLEFARRAISIAVLLAVLVGLPLTVFLVIANLLWAVVFIAAMGRLAQRGAITLHFVRFPRELRAFFAANRHAIWKSSAGALSEIFVVTFPYYVVPAAFGLGAAPIILDTAFKIFRGACVIFAAVCDLAVPGQTRAYAAGDEVGLPRPPCWRQACARFRRSRPVAFCSPAATRFTGSCCTPRQPCRPRSRPSLSCCCLLASCRSSPKRSSSTPAISRASP